MAAERFFTQIAQEVLDATERISNHFDTNWNFLFSGSTNDTTTTTTNDGGSNDGGSNYQESILHNDPDNNDDFDDNTSPLQGMAEQVLSGIMDKGARPQTLLEHINAFQSAITWTDPFIIGIILFQCIMFLCTIYVSRYNTSFALRLTMMLFMAIIVRLSEYINRYGAQHWNTTTVEWWGTSNTKIMTQNYFDPQGYFMTIMICGPLLLYTFIMLCCYLHEASTLLIQVKKMQLKKKQQQPKNQLNGASKAETPTKKDQ